MAFNPVKTFRILFYAAAAAYPALVFYFLSVRKVPVRTVSLFIIAFSLLAFIARTSKKKSGAEKLPLLRQNLFRL
ncbi:MAG: hypothetical protein LBI67_01765 [Treponema sp.]|jgi:VIT1/CCC1 family predicted Fe2+/Mn2+ transporter|nr:hypothetical protein [Treponema sp.]